MARRTAHYLDDTAALMGSGGVAHLIDSVHSCIYRRIKSDGVVRAGDIKIDGTRHAYSVDAAVCKGSCAPEGAVAADDYHTVDTVLPAYFRALFLAFFRHKLGAARRKQDSTATLDGVGHCTARHIDDVLFKKSGVTAPYTFYLKAVCQRRSHNASNCGVHARSIASARKNANCFNLSFAHSFMSCLPDLVSFI